MNKFFPSFMNTFRNLSYTFLAILFFIAPVKAEECIAEYDNGNDFSIVVKSNPVLTSNSGYSQGNLSQRSIWTDSGLFTSGTEFVFEITGDWNPFGGSNSENFLSKTMCTFITRNRDDSDRKCINSDAEYCTKDYNSEKEIIGLNGEYDYLANLYTIVKIPEGNKQPITYVKDKTREGKGERREQYKCETETKAGDNNNSLSKCKKDYIDVINQKECWITGGEGLYVAFFGQDGNTLPNIATHLKSAVIACDKEYATDKNDDGVISVDECYGYKQITKNKYEMTPNMAYYMAYKPNSYITAYPACNAEFLHDPYGNKKTMAELGNKIYLTGCYQEVKNAKGEVIDHINRLYFIFKANYLYKGITNGKPEKVGKNQSLKFIIYDRYYSDNSGEYTINIKGGAVNPSEPGLIEKILTDLESTFIGIRNEYGQLEGGVLKQFYTYIIQDTMFMWTVRMFIILYMAFLGMQFSMGVLNYSTKELMNILLKLTFILGFTTITSWDIYDYFIVRFFFDGLSNIVIIMADISNRIFDPDAVNTVGTSMATKFAFFDDLIKMFFSKSFTYKTLGMFFGVWYGFIVIPIIYGLIIYFIVQMINSIFPYILMFIQAIIALILGPVFIAFYLFKPTEGLFKNWLAFIGARFVNMAFFFLFFFAFVDLIRDRFMQLLSVRTCKVPLLNAIFSGAKDSAGKVATFFSFGLKVWKSTKSGGMPSFFSFALELLFIFVLIYLFGQLIKKVPDIVDSMVDIGGQAGGGVKSGSSVLFDKKDAPRTFYDSFQSVVDSDKKRVIAPMKQLLKDATGAVGKRIGKHVNNFFGYIPRKVGELRDRYHVKSDVFLPIANEGQGLKGINAIDAMVEELGKKRNETETNNFKNSAMKRYITKPLAKEMNKFINELGKKGIDVNREDGEKILRERLDQFAKEHLMSNPNSKEDLERIRGIYENMPEFKVARYSLPYIKEQQEKQKEKEREEQERQEKQKEIEREKAEKEKMAETERRNENLSRKAMELGIADNLTSNYYENLKIVAAEERRRYELAMSEFKEQMKKITNYSKKDNDDLNKIYKNKQEEVQKESETKRNYYIDNKYNPVINKINGKLDGINSKIEKNRLNLEKDGLSRIKKAILEARRNELQSRKNRLLKAMQEAEILKKKNLQKIDIDNNKKIDKIEKDKAYRDQLLKEEFEKAVNKKNEELKKLNDLSNERLKLIENQLDSLTKELKDLGTKEEIERRLAEDQEFKKYYEQLIKDASEFSDGYFGKDANDPNAEIKKEEFFMQGLDPETFGVQGITSDFFGKETQIGLTIENDNNFTLVNQDVATEKNKEKDDGAILLEAREKIAKINKKSIDFKLALEESKGDAGDQDLIRDLKNQQKEVEKEIKKIETSSQDA